MRKVKMKKGFTLAEVLLTLTIVGIVASITIPTIKANVDKAGYVAGVKKAYSVLQQAFTMAQNDNGGVIDTLFGNIPFDISLNAFVKNMNVSQNCGTAANSPCIYNSIMKKLNGFDDTNYYSNSNFAKAILSDGMIILFQNFQTGCTTTALESYIGVLKNSTCGLMFVDVNGFKSPNQWGRDVFQFWITKTGIYPMGGTAYDNESCIINGVGTGCTGKVLQEGAMNY